ncbi:MAG: twitching motility protein PilT [Saprospirales bacterium]|nr:twitching motility protein PilT [Saprospirales bacterium]
MNGRFLLDTNAVIGLLSGNAALLQLLKGAKWIGISVIVELEFLSFPQLSDSDAKLFAQFKSRVETISLDSTNEDLLQNIVRIRQKSKIKLPDAIIAATAMNENAALVSNDVSFNRIDHLNLLTF